MTTTTTAQTTQVYQVFKARIENSSDGHRSKGPDGTVWSDEPMYEFDPPRRMVHGWRSLYSPTWRARSRAA
jgi:hypothetical protein